MARSGRFTVFVPSERRRPEDIDFADRWTGEPCTLDSRPAVVVGRLLRFAEIHSLDRRAGDQVVSFAWSTVDRIMSTHRAFRS